MKKIIIAAATLLCGLTAANAESAYKDGTENGHDYVDLGLTSGTLWATTNVGAANPEDYGNYYAWGETTTKDSYRWNSYLDGNFSNIYDCGTENDALNGVTDIAGSKNDAAKANWGGNWVMPTHAQIEELFDECYMVWTSNYNSSNVAGFIVYKAKNSSDKGVKIYSGETQSSSYSQSDAHIFLPAAGYRSGDDLNNAGSDGSFWSSSLYSSEPYLAWIDSYGSDNVEIFGGDRSCGVTVRAVIAKSAGTRASDATAEKKAEVKKVMRDGVIYIIKGDEVYGVNGNRVK